MTRRKNCGENDLPKYKDPTLKQNQSKHALVLGATSDIGKHIALGLANRGYNLYLTGRDLKLLEEIKDGIISANPVAVKNFFFDITAFGTHAEFYNELNIKPEIVFCCVGYYQDQRKARQNFEETLATISTNFTGVVSILNIIANDFETRRSGSIIAISSVAGERGRQLNYIYGSAKAGLSVYLSGLRNRLHRSGVSVTTIQLGPVYTKMSKGHKLFPVITLQPDIAAEKIIRAGFQRKGIVHIFWAWRYIMFAIRLIPEFIFKRLRPF